jgi:hypothetical protein
MKEMEKLPIFNPTTFSSARLGQDSDPFQYPRQSFQWIVNEKPDGL